MKNSKKHKIDKSRKNNRKIDQERIKNQNEILKIPLINTFFKIHKISYLDKV